MKIRTDVRYWDNAARVASARRKAATTDAERAYWDRAARHAVAMMTGAKK